MIDFLFYKQQHITNSLVSSSSSSSLLSFVSTSSSREKRVQFDLNHDIVLIPSRNDLKPFNKDLFYSHLDYYKFRILEYNRQLESASWRENRRSVLAEKYQDQQPTLLLDTL